VVVVDVWVVVEVVKNVSESGTVLYVTGPPPSIF
jgi:hypothetical protein